MGWVSRGWLLMSLVWSSGGLDGAPEDQHDFGLVASGSDHQTQVTVWVYNRYPVPSELLQIGLRQTATIFEHAGIRIRWLDCLPAGLQGATDPACLPGPRSNTIVLTVLGRADGRYRRSLGYAFQRDDGGKSVVVYYWRVGFMVEFAPAEAAELLGAVIAHEIGHALLPGQPHSKEGIMRPEWEAREAHASLRGQMNFSARESGAMRNELNRRATIESNFPTR